MHDDSYTDPALTSILNDHSRKIIREYNALNVLRSNANRSRYFQFYYDLFTNPQFTYTSFEQELCKRLRNISLDFSNTESVYESLYSITLDVLHNLSSLSINSNEFCSNKSVHNTLAYRYSLLYPSVGTYHIFSNAESLYNHSFTDINSKIKHSDAITRTQILFKNPVVIDKVGMSKHFTELIQKRLMGYVLNGIEGAKPKNYYTSTVLDTVLSVNRSHLPSTQAECLHICIATGNISELERYIQLIQTEYGLNMDSIKEIIIEYIRSHTTEIEFITSELIKSKPSNANTNGTQMFNESKNYDKTACVRTDFDTYHFEMCILIYPEQRVSSVDAFIIICSEIAALLSSICPNHVLAIDSILYEFTEDFNAYMQSANTECVLIIAQLQYALQRIISAHSVFESYFSKIDSMNDLLKNKYNQTTSEYINDNRILKHSLLPHKLGNTYDYSTAFDNMNSLIRSHFPKQHLFPFTDVQYDLFKKYLRAGKNRKATQLLTDISSNMNIHTQSIDEYIKSQTLSVLRELFPINVLTSIVV